MTEPLPCIRRKSGKICMCRNESSFIWWNRKTSGIPFLATYVSLASKVDKMPENAQTASRNSERIPAENTDITALFGVL